MHLHTSKRGKTRVEACRVFRDSARTLTTVMQSEKRRKTSVSDFPTITLS